MAPGHRCLDGDAGHCRRDQIGFIIAAIQLNKEQTMSGTSLYRALVHAGAPEAEAKEAAADLNTLNRDISDLKIMVAEIRVTNRILIALLIAVLIKSFF